jgi:hypothetical protein
MKKLLAILALSLVVPSLEAQTAKPVKVRVVYDTEGAASAAVGALLAKKIAAQPKFFQLVNGDDRDLAIVADCYQETAKDPYSCFYIATKWIESNEGLLGGGVIVQKSPDDAANALFTSIVQDVAERWNNTNRRMLIAELETCLALTESSCAVPTPLQAELATKSINLSQYMRKGGLKP